MKITIVGAGTAGLVTALILKQKFKCGCIRLAKKEPTNQKFQF